MVNELREAGHYLKSLRDFIDDVEKKVTETIEEGKPLATIWTENVLQRAIEIHSRVVAAEGAYRAMAVSKMSHDISDNA